MFKSVEDLQKFGVAQMEAASQSATALTQGMQQIVSEATTLSQKTVATGTEAFQDLLASRSVDRAIQVQMDFAKSAYDSMVSGSSKMGGIMSATAQDMFKPLEGAVARMGGAVRN